MDFINILGQQYPLKFGYSALTKFLKIAKKTKFTEIGEVINDFPVSGIPEGIQALVQNGIKVEKSETKAPSLDEIREELDNNIMLWVTVLNLVSESVTPPAIDEGNSLQPIIDQ